MAIDRRRFLTLGSLAAAGAATRGWTEEQPHIIFNFTYGASPRIIALTVSPYQQLHFAGKGFRGPAGPCRPDFAYAAHPAEEGINDKITQRLDEILDAEGFALEPNRPDIVRTFLQGGPHTPSSGSRFPTEAFVAGGLDERDRLNVALSFLSNYGRDAAILTFTDGKETHLLPGIADQDAPFTFLTGGVRYAPMDLMFGYPIGALPERYFRMDVDAEPFRRRAWLSFVPSSCKDYWVFDEKRNYHIFQPLIINIGNATSEPFRVLTLDPGSDEVLHTFPLDQLLPDYAHEYARMMPERKHFRTSGVIKLRIDSPEAASNLTTISFESQIPPRDTTPPIYNRNHVA